MTSVPSSPVTVNDLILAENTVTVTGSLGAMSTLPNLGLELTLTLLFSASDVLAGAAEASRPGHRHRRRCRRRHRDDHVLLRTAAPGKDQQERREQGDQGGRPAPQSPDGRPSHSHNSLQTHRSVLFRRTGQFTSDAQRCPFATTVGRGREVPVTAGCQWQLKVAGRTPGLSSPASARLSPAARRSATAPGAASPRTRCARRPGSRRPTRSGRPSLPPRLVSARVCLLDTATRPPGPG